MIRGGSARLRVSEIDRAVRFYVETLGFKLRARGGDDWADVDAGEGLVLTLAAATGDGACPGMPGATTVQLELNQPIAEVVAVLGNRGVIFHGGIREEAGVKVAYCSDPDGNALVLAEGRPEQR